MSIKEHPPHLHVPVLLDSMLHVLDPKEGESYLDLTAGYGGHAAAILSKTDNYEGSTLVDRDEFAISKLEQRFAGTSIEIVATDFVTAAETLAQQGRHYDLVCVDLGVSSPQLDQSERGFSFLREGPLDMRMDRRQEVSAKTLINTANVQELTRIIHEYGEEPTGMSRRIADAIVKARPLETTTELANLVEQVYGGRYGRIHPATRTFQAIRIAVNDELGQIDRLLPLLPQLLNKGGRVGVISFHSLEDIRVKRFFKEQQQAGYEAELQVLTKKPISGLEDVHNPRSRSAKLRAAVKL